jgi:hypothetical protein
VSRCAAGYGCKGPVARYRQTGYGGVLVGEAWLCERHARMLLGPWDREPKV